MTASLTVHLLKREVTPVAPPVIDERTDKDGRDGSRVRCPQCGWEPAAHDRWACSCLHLWNTFETRGICPACDKHWHETQCPRCNTWSPHEDWYSSRDAED